MTRTDLGTHPWMILIALGLALLPVTATAEQDETVVTCDEGALAEPVPMAYGNHTEGCAISPASEINDFDFCGDAEDLVRFIVRSASPGCDPELEIRDPESVLIVDGQADGAFCSGSSGAGASTCSFTYDLILPQEGCYPITLFDSGNDEAGSYVLQIERILPILYHDETTIDGLSPTTDVDVYALLGTVGTLQRFDVLSTRPGFDPVLEIRDPTGTVVVDGVDDGAFCDGSSDTGATKCSFRIEFAPKMDGIYTLALYDHGVDETGNYEIALRCMVGSCSDPVRPLICDNCIETPNGPLIPDAGGNSQRDTDGDGYGNVCDCDFNQDGVCDFLDLGEMKEVFFCGCGDVIPPCNDSEDKDMNGNCIVAFQDLGWMKSRFFLPLGPSFCALRR